MKQVRLRENAPLQFQSHTPSVRSVGPKHEPKPKRTGSGQRCYSCGQTGHKRNRCGAKGNSSSNSSAARIRIATKSHAKGTKVPDATVIEVADPSESEPNSSDSPDPDKQKDVEPEVEQPNTFIGPVYGPGEFPPVEDAPGWKKGLNHSSTTATGPIVCDRSAIPESLVIEALVARSNAHSEVMRELLTRRNAMCPASAEEEEENRINAEWEIEDPVGECEPFKLGELGKVKENYSYSEDTKCWHYSKPDSSNLPPYLPDIEEPPTGRPEEWWTYNEPLAEQVRRWEFSFHDFFTLFRWSGKQMVSILSLVPLITILAIMLLWYPNLETLAAIVLVLGFSVSIRFLPSIHPLITMCVEIVRSAVDSLEEIRRNGFYLLFSRARRLFLGVPCDYPNFLYLILASCFLSLVALLLSLLFFVFWKYISYTLVLADFILTWEVWMWKHILPSNFWQYWLSLPEDLRHLIAWISWFKYLGVTYWILYYYADLFLRSTSVTSVYFKHYVEERVAGDKRQHTFRNQDLLAKSCPFVVGITRRTFFGLIPLMREDRRVSATMIMELTAHKFLNGSVELPDTIDRINRAMQGIGYLDIDAYDIFGNCDTAEASRILSIYWAKYRLEANFGLRLQDF